MSTLSNNMVTVQCVHIDYIKHNFSVPTKHRQDISSHLHLSISVFKKAFLLNVYIEAFYPVFIICIILIL